MTMPNNALTERDFITSPSIIIPGTFCRTVTAVVIPHDTSIAGWHLKSLLLVEITPADMEFVATTWLEGVAEYGTGETEADAKTDLVVSLGEYREALEERQDKLGDSALRELDYLRKLIERSS